MGTGAWGWERGDGNVRTEAGGREQEDRSMWKGALGMGTCRREHGVGAWRRERRDGSMVTGAWDGSMGIGTWERKTFLHHVIHKKNFTLT